MSYDHCLHTFLVSEIQMLLFQIFHVKYFLDRLTFENFENAAIEFWIFIYNWKSIIKASRCPTFLFNVILLSAILNQKLKFATPHIKQAEAAIQR